MSFNYTSFEGFQKYCLGICNNKNYKLSMNEIDELLNFKKI